MSLSLRSSLVCLAFSLSALSTLPAQFDFTDSPPIGVTETANVVHVADLDGDDVLDIVIAIVGSGDLRIAYGDGSGQYDSTTVVTGAPPAADIETVDLDGDGAHEILVSSAVSNTLVVLSPLGGGPYQLVQLVNTASTPGRLTCGDFDSDGDDDVGVTLVAGLFPSAVQRFTNVGSLTLVAGGVTSVPPNPVHLLAAELTGDGNTDLLVSSLGEFGGTPGGLSLLIGNGIGGFGPPATIASGSFGDFSVGDLNGDFWADIVAVQENPFFSCANEILVYKGIGGGQFDPDINVEAACGPLTVLLADLDTDGTLDVLAAEGGDLIPSMNILWGFPGFGDGSFDLGAPVAFGDFVITPIQSGDLDSNGSADLVLLGYFGGISALLNDNATIEFLRADSNGDGRVDLSDPVASLAALFVPLSEAPGCIDAADVNDDGIFDVSDVVWHLNALFVLGSPPVPPPYPGCGFDPSPDSLTCLVPCP